ncbi:MAG: SDR family oxidoreductase [Caldilineaceae bacterium]|nr:SDR family oxidoreductase [Caldilineaceae bacterium]MCB0142920.1 SDR family oxidoreductase [Caldilineaceae bacterium]
MDNKVILITGGIQGIGGATAQICAERGARVIVVDINADKGEAFASSMRSSGHDVQFYRLDVRDAAAVEAVFAQVQESYGHLDVLICAAGVLEGALLQPEEFPLETFDFVMDVNVKGAFLCVKYATPLLAASEKGVIILVASGAGVIGGSSSIAYGTSKGAVNGLGMTLEGHLGQRGIRVNVVCPGSIETELKLNQMRAAAAYQGQEFSQEEASKRLGNPLGVGKLLAFLASDEAEYVKRNMFTR